MELFVVLAQILFNLIFFFNLTWLYSGEVIEMAELLGVCWLNIEGKIRDDAEKITSEPRGSRTLETTPAQQKEKTSQRAPVWCLPNTLRRSN